MMFAKYSRDIVRLSDHLHFIKIASGAMLWKPRFGGTTKGHDMTKKDQDSHQLIDLGAATIVTKGLNNNGPQDDPSSQRIFQMGLNAE